jgi:hypothetical protein
MTETNDEFLMEQVMQGDLQKASALFESYNKKLYSFFVRLTFDKDLSHDLTECFFTNVEIQKILQKRCQFQTLDLSDSQKCAG